MQVQSNGSKGFTIVELLIVVIVIAILATITVVAFTNIRQRAVSSAQLSELSQLQKKIQVDVLNDTGATITISQPIASVVGLGSSPLSTSLRNAQNITLYGVFDTNNSPGTTNWAAIVSFYAASPTNSFRLRSTASSSAGGFYANDIVQNTEMSQAGIFNTTRRHVGWITATPGTIASGFDGSSGATRTLADHAGWSFETMSVHAGGQTFTGVAGLAFAEYHDAATRAQVVQWLNKQYNVGL